MKLTADLLILAGVASLLAFGWAMVDGAYYQFTQRHRFEAAISKAELADGSLGTAEEISPPEARPRSARPIRLLQSLLNLPERDPLIVGELEVPRIGLSVMVREGVDDATLRRAAGHLPSTALPGEPGNLVILAHRDTFFRGLRDLEQGDTVRISTTRATFSYKIESIQVVEPDGIDLTSPASEAVATFVTCFPFNYIGPAPRRFVARARLN